MEVVTNLMKVKVLWLASDQINQIPYRYSYKHHTCNHEVSVDNISFFLLVKNFFFRTQNGLSVSLLERLMTTCSLYERKDSTYDKRYITKLINNYRSHEKILEVSF